MFSFNSEISIWTTFLFISDNALRLKAAGDITASASQEFNEGDATTFGVTYAAGNVTFGAAYDSGGADLFGDEADTVISATYVDGDVTIAGKANTQDEMEVSVSFAF